MEPGDGSLGFAPVACVGYGLVYSEAGVVTIFAFGVEGEVVWVIC